MSTIRVIASGLLSTFQDGGRNGFRKFGVPVSGVMDTYSAGLANLLLNNAANDPVLEVTMQGPTLEFNCNTRIAIVGADISAKINDRLVDRNKVIEINVGDLMSFGKLISGCRCYLAVSGGFEIEKVLDSYSYYPGIADNNMLKSGMIIPVKEDRSTITSYSSVRVNPNHLSALHIKVHKGPEFKMLPKQQQSLLFKKNFRVSPRNNRMGYQLEGNLLEIEKYSMLTAVTIPGTVQLTPAGNPIVLMRDCQTTGGYPRILQLTENGINRLAQKKTNDSIRFQLT